MTPNNDPLSRSPPMPTSLTPSQSTADRERILGYIREQRGATCDELEEALGLRHQTASARVYELAGRGKTKKTPARIRPCGERRLTRSGRFADVYMAVEQAAPTEVSQS